MNEQMNWLTTKPVREVKWWKNVANTQFRCIAGETKSNRCKENVLQIIVNVYLPYFDYLSSVMVLKQQESFIEV